MSIKLVIGLGNAGAQYERTRHNAGRIVLARLAGEISERSGNSVVFSSNKYCAAALAKCSIGSQELILACADGFMNNSGVNLKNILKFLKLDISETAVIYDDITLDVGRMKLSKGGSAGGHNGVLDIMEHCGNEFVRIRVGIGGKLDKRMDLADHVLGRLSQEDFEKVCGAKIFECVSLLVSKGLEAAQNVVNRTSQEHLKKGSAKARPDISSNGVAAELSVAGNYSGAGGSEVSKSGGDSLDKLACDIEASKKSSGERK